MSAVLHAEWTKLRTLPSTLALLVTAVALTVGLSALAAATTDCPAPGCRVDPARVGLSGVQLGQAAVAALAVLVLAGEYGSGTITTTMTAMPRRTRVLVAKAGLVAVLTLGAATAGVLGSLLVARVLLPRHGFTRAHGVPPLSLTDPAVLRATVGSILYLVLVALLSLGVAAVVREPVAAAGTALGLLYLLGAAPFVIASPVWQRRLWRISPMDAGLTVQATARLSDLPIGPLAGAAVLVAWTAAALLAGGLLLRRRDV